RLLHFVVYPDFGRIPEIALLRLAVLLLPARVVHRSHQSAAESELLSLEDVGRLVVYPELHDGKRDVHAVFYLQRELVHAIRPELVISFIAGVVLLREPRLVEVGAARIGAGDPLALGPPLPLAHIRIVGPKILVQSQVALALLALRLGEQDHQLLVRASAVDDRLAHHICFVFLLLLEIDERLVVPIVLLPIVQRAKQLKQLVLAHRRASRRTDYEQRESKEEGRRSDEAHGRSADVVYRRDRLHPGGEEGRDERDGTGAQGDKQDRAEDLQRIRQQAQRVVHQEQLNSNRYRDLRCIENGADQHSH